jgi:hypothetical protein
MSVLVLSRVAAMSKKRARRSALSRRKVIDDVDEAKGGRLEGKR